MARKVQTIKKTIRQEAREKDGNEYLYELSMLESSMVASYGLPLYSINVQLTMHSGEKTAATVKEKFADAGQAICFFERLVDNLATPIDLPYIVEDEL